MKALKEIEILIKQTQAGVRLCKKRLDILSEPDRSILKARIEENEHFVEQLKRIRKILTIKRTHLLDKNKFINERNIYL